MIFITHARTADDAAGDQTTRTSGIRTENMKRKEIKAMKYEFSNMEVKGIDGKVYKVCDRCHIKQQSNYGLEFEYRVPTQWQWMRMGLCRKCANELKPQLQNFFSDFCDFGAYETEIESDETEVGPDEEN